MKCEECLRLVDLYLDRELRPDARSQVSEHLANCENCQTRYRTLENENAFFLENSPVIDPSPAFWSRVSQETHLFNHSPQATGRGFPVEPATAPRVLASRDRRKTLKLAQKFWERWRTAVVERAAHPPGP